MANFNPKDSLDKLLLFFVVAMSCIMLFAMGTDVHERNWTGLATGAVTVAFFIAFGVLIVWQRMHELKQKIEARDRDLEMLRNNTTAPPNEVATPSYKLLPEIEELLNKVVKPAIRETVENEHDREMLQAVLTDMGYIDKRPDDSVLPRIAAAFHENTDRYVRLVPQADGKIGIDFSAEPFVEDAGQPETVTTTTTASKPLTKSQQRRINAQKGLGALTDEEVHAARLEKRRQARAAKKAAKEGGPTTTTTTTLPGQTGLPGVE